jgi:hypothetical protein
VLGFGVGAGVNTLWRLSTVPAALRARRSGEANSLKIGTIAFEAATGLFICFVCVSLVTMVLLVSESFFTRQGRFSGAGAVIVWPAAR